MALAAPLIIRYGVAEWKPAGIGETAILNPPSACDQTSQWLIQLDAVVFKISNPGEAPVGVIFAFLDRNAGSRQLRQEPLDVADAVVDLDGVSFSRQNRRGGLDREDDRGPFRSVGVVVINELKPVILYAAAVSAGRLKCEPEMTGI